MKQHIFAVVPDVDIADRVINHLHTELQIPSDEISYLYRDRAGDVIAGEGSEIAQTTPGEGATSGAAVGGVVGAAIGLVGAAGVLGPLGAVVAGGPLATALGITGALGGAVAGGATGAAVGGLVGALTNMGVDEPRARSFQERVMSGDVLISVHTDRSDEAVALLEEYNATEITTIGPTTAPEEKIT